MLIILAYLSSLTAFAEDSSIAYRCQAPSPIEGYPHSIELTRDERDEHQSSLRTINGQSYVITPQASGVVVSIPQKQNMSYTCHSAPASDRHRYPEMYDCEADKKDSSYPADFMISERTVATQNKKRPYPIEEHSYFVSGKDGKVEFTALVGKVDFKCVKIAVNREIASEGN